MKALIAPSLVLTSTLLAGVAHAATPADTYRVTNLPSLGGTVSRGNSINDRGWIAGYSNLPGDQSRHAALWLGGSIFDLGTLGGPNSSVAWPVKNNRGLIVGISQTATPEPLGESWSCAAFFPGATATGYTCLGFVWEKGVMKALPTLGGNNGFAAGANNRGQVVGWAENTVHDPTCVPPQVLQFRPVLWDPSWLEWNNGAARSSRRSPATPPAPPPRSTTGARSWASRAPATRRSAGSPPLTPCSGRTAR